MFLVARDRNQVKIFGIGFEAELRVDAVEVLLGAAEAAAFSS